MSPQRDLSRISVIVDEKTKRTLRQLARERSRELDEDVRISHLVREAITQYLRRAAQQRSLRRIAEDREQYRAAR